MTMRILYVHERFGALAGAESNVGLTGRELKKRGHEIALLHGPGTGKGEEAWRETFSPRFPLDSAPRAAAERALREFAPDIIYVHKMADLGVIETLVRSGRATARMVHDHDIYCMRSYKYNYFTRAICRRPAGLHCVTLCGASLARNRAGGFPLKWVSYSDKKKEIRLNQEFGRMVVVSRYMRDELLANGFDPARIEIHPPVPLLGDPDLQANRAQRNLILFAGQIIRGKGLDVLLRALALIRTPFECLVLGDGSHRAHCEALSRKLKLGERVRFLGFVPQENLKKYYSEGTVFALPSVWPEPFATVGMEVMRYGLPVVAFDVGGISDWLHDGENGYLVPVGDAPALARRLEGLLLDKTLARQMGQRGLELVNERFGFNAYLQNLEGMFSNLLTAK
ncbi:MAG TPA: glycosyltransferase family 4 protein [Verrucomicrobiae bacterium]|jgi:glycosyltransferase involved in cell wall biosynthesis|nr:glycosyltransferase family 4 protein [Verrucomicrobiae bacterium]